MSFIYLACPYSYPEENVRLFRFKQANIAASKLMNEGHVVYSAISHTHPIAVDASLPLGWDYWQNVDEVFISLCHTLAVLKLPGWQESKGVNAEMEIAQRLGKSIIFIEPS